MSKSLIMTLFWGTLHNPQSHHVLVMQISNYSFLFIIPALPVASVRNLTPHKLVSSRMRKKDEQNSDFTVKKQLQTVLGVS